MSLRASRRRRDERGAIAVLTAVSATLMLVMAAFAVDYGNTWARRGQLQVQADRAAVFAASYLPADTAADKTEVARAVAYYYACHPVLGQTGVVRSVPRPACPSSPSSTNLNTYAAALLADSMVTFPARNQVRVVTPTARVEFGFGKVAGAEGVDQEKVATAKVTSPGMLSPMAATLDCLLNPFSNTIGATPLTFGYMATTHSSSSTTLALPANSTPATAEPDNVGVDPGQAQQVVLGVVSQTMRISGKHWPAVTSSVGWTYAAVFKRSTSTYESAYVTAWVPSVSGLNNNRRGYIDVIVPTSVMRVAGTWKVQVIAKNATGTKSYSTDYDTFDVVSPYPDVRGCGRLIKSPRGDNNNNENFTLNIQEGIDHLLTTYPYVASSDPQSVADLRALFGLTACNASSSSTVKDNVHPSGTPNCLITDMSNAYEAGFTEGLIGASGRLTCITAHPCRSGHTTVINSRTINDDHFSDFVKNPSLLTHDSFFSFDSFLTTGVPVVTPTSNLDRDIYNSGRFMWVPMISTLTATSALATGDYPILTFRPIFITQGNDVLKALPLLDSTKLSMGLAVPDAIDVVDGFMRQTIPGTDNSGLIMNGSSVSAVRYMLISPDSLPAVPADYSGPESEYLGVGPRIIRLVE